MENYKLSIALIATLITISLNSCVSALTCAYGPPTASNPTVCGADAKLCFAKSDASGAVTRGCVTDESCTGNPLCVTCDTDNCNTNVMCKTCVGSDAICGTTTASGVANKICTTATQECLNQLNDNGTVTRDCGEKCDSVNCKSCTTDLCNVGLYPANRLKCYQCDGATCNTATATVLNGCPIYQATGQKCYTTGTSNTTMQRGCSPDPGQSNSCAGATPDSSCVFCETDACNSLMYEQVLGKCYKCNDNSTCVGAQPANQAVDCDPAKYTDTPISCYTQRSKDGTVQRGCMTEHTGECTDAVGCTTCTGDACNANASVEPPFSCLLCRSDYDAKCRQATDIAPTTCTNAGTTETAHKCFEGQWDGVVLRGCLADAAALTIYQCLNNDDKRCTICETSNCNKTPFNGASSLKHMGLGFLGLIFVVKQFM